MFKENADAGELGSSSRQPQTATATLPGPSGRTVAAPSPEWRRFSFRRSWVWLELPVVAVILASAALLLAIVLTDDANDILRKLFEKLNPGVEASAGTWVNAGLWLMAGLVAGYIALHVREHRKSWATVSVLSVYFSLDETVMLHEHLNGVFADFAPLRPFANFVWVIPGAVLALLIAGLLFRMVLSLPRTSRHGILGGGAVFVTGSIGVEIISGLVHVQHGGGSDYYDALRIVEESLEMTGVALAIAAMLHLIEWRRVDEAMAYRVNVQREAESPARS